MRRAVLPVVVLLAFGTGCFASKETREGADRLEEALGTPPWARSVAVETGVSGISDDVVETFVVLLPLLGTEPTAELSRTTGGNAYVASLADGGAQAVAGLFDELRADTALAVPADAWSVSAAADGTATSLVAPTLPPDRDIRAWVALVQALELLPPRFEAVSVSLQRYDPHAGVGLKLLMPDDVTRENITPANYGAELWPVLRAQLRTVAGLRGGWSYLVQWAPADVPDWTTIMLSLLDDEQPIDNHDPATLWSEQARDYVDGL